MHPSKLNKNPIFDQKLLRVFVLQKFNFSKIELLWIQILRVPTQNYTLEVRTKFKAQFQAKLRFVAKSKILMTRIDQKDENMTKVNVNIHKAPQLNFHRAFQLKWLKTLKN